MHIDGDVASQVIVVTLTPQCPRQECDLLFDRELGQQSVAGWFKRLRGHEVYSYRSMITTVRCTPPLVFLVAEMGAFSLVFATSFAKKFQLGDREFSGFGIEFEFPSAFVGGVVMP
jgi:hypothetical protein